MCVLSRMDDNPVPNILSRIGETYTTDYYPQEEQPALTEDIADITHQPADVVHRESKTNTNKQHVH